MKEKTEKIINNSLTELVSAVRVSTMLTGGSDLASYGTIAYNNNYSLLTLNRVILTYLYTSSGIIQTAIDLPVQDALSKGVEIESNQMSSNEIDTLLDYMEETDQWQALEDALNWARLYGGSGLVLASNQDPTAQLDRNRLKYSPIAFYDVDRWQFDNARPYAAEYETDYYGGKSPDLFYLYGQPIHESRVILIRGKRAPYYVRRQLRGWGMSECERMIKDLNLYLKTQNVLYEILDESKIDIYKLKGFAEKLIHASGTSQIERRVQLANELKNYVNALILDANDDYEQKQMTFGGLADIMRENRIGVASALRMPVTKLFGLSASGFNTGESDLENYNMMIESEVRKPAKPVIRKMIEINMYHLFGRVAPFQLKFPSLRVLSAEQEQNVKNSEYNRIVGLYDRGLFDSKETGQSLRQADIINIETRMERGVLPDFPEPPNSPESIDAVPGVGIATNSLTYSGHPIKQRIKFQGMDISIENPRGSVRTGEDENGKPWRTRFNYPYGYIRGTQGVDKDHVDCYVGDDPDSQKAFIIAQNSPITGRYDEDKVMLGFDTAEAAKRAYKQHYDKPGFYGDMKEVSIDQLKKLLEKRKGKQL